MKYSEAVKTLKGSIELTLLTTLAATSLTFQQFAELARHEYKERGITNGLRGSQISHWAKGTFGLSRGQMKDIMDKHEQRWLEKDAHLSTIDEDITVIVVTHNNTLLEKLGHLIFG